MSHRAALWDQRIRRAETLAAASSSTASMLVFYATVLREQKALYDSFTHRRPSGSIEGDVTLLAEGATALLAAVAESGPDQLAAEARSILEGSGRPCEELLLTYWCTRSDRGFFAKALFQPYGQWLVDAGVAMSFAAASTANRCPRCGGAPQLSVLESGAAAAADGSGRHLLCATCLTPWPFRRVVCPACGEENERQLGYFQSDTFTHVRVDACESCHRYLKTIDLGQLGLAVPLADEVAAAPLDIWARERGYEKVELNLVGL